ncbi:protein FATTY ACID EXPORT 3, chloroplastic-like [Aristolochia californica]|uniref:protein FATTY ACID EXPORT 3, chloroplastic-like n=1 Tax=Aristolochia californica TaxID=171875 RepID=UPI0035D5D4CA
MALSMAALSHRPGPTSSLRFDPFRAPAVAGASFLPRSESAVSTENVGNGLCTFAVRPVKLNRGRLVFSLAAFSQDESKHSDIEVEQAKNEVDQKEEESQEAWEQTLEVFKEQAAKLQAISQASYEAYSKKAMIILKDTSERLKIEANNARRDLAIVAKEFGDEGLEYLSSVAEKSPEPVKEVVETFSSSTPKFTHLSEVRDFYLGIPYGLFLSAGGFLSFMLTGSIAAIRFGVILGGTLLALSVQSLRCWKRGESSSPYLKGQTAIATIIFLRELRFLAKSASLPTFMLTLISGIMVLFYSYRIWLNKQKWDPSVDQHPQK